MKIRTTCILCLSLAIIIDFEANAQDNRVSLRQILQMAEANYPLLKSKMLDVQAAQKGVQAGRSSIIPSLDASYQLNYATYNNITGMAYPQYLIPISGPPSSTNNMNPVYGSASSLLLNWQPITFGQRNAQVDFAKAGLLYASADETNEIFQHKFKVINAYLDLLTATELLKVYENNLKRTESNLHSVQSLVTSGIRPGVDTSIFRAEVTKARVEYLNNRQFKEQTRIGLLQLLASGNNISFSDTAYFTSLPANLSSNDSSRHPLLGLFDANVAIAQARKKVLSRTMMPMSGVWGTTFARGSDIASNGSETKANGMNFQRYNYGIGIQLSVPLLQSARIHSQLQQQNFVIESAIQKRNEIELQLSEQRELADSSLHNALEVAKESPLFLESALFSFRALQARYQSGLISIADLLQAQYILIKAETDNKLAFMHVWKALLFKAAINGKLDLFINQVN